MQVSVGRVLCLYSLVVMMGNVAGIIIIIAQHFIFEQFVHKICI